MYSNLYTYATIVSIERELAERYAARQASADAFIRSKSKQRPGGGLTATIGRIRSAFRPPRWMIRPVQP